MTATQSQHTPTTANPRGFEATAAHENPASHEGGAYPRPSSYRHVLALISEASEWADPYELEALAEAAFEAYASQPDLCTPYGRGFGVVDMSKAVRS